MGLLDDIGETFRDVCLKNTKGEYIINLNALGSIGSIGGHCGHLLMFASEDVPERGIKKGEPYCLKCPGISMMDEHCCVSTKCADQLLKHKEELKRMWNENHPANQVTEPAESLNLQFPLVAEK